MDFGFSEEQEMLRQSVREFLDGECPMTYVRADDGGRARLLRGAVEKDGRARLDRSDRSRGAWRRRADHGRHGRRARGDGPGRHARAVLRVGDPRRHRASTSAAARSRSSAISPAWRAAKRATLAQVEESGRWDAEGIELAATSAEARLPARPGPSCSCHDAHNADLLVVPARTGGGGSGRHHVVPGRREGDGRDDRACSRRWIRRASSARSGSTASGSAARRCSVRSAAAGRCSIASSIAPRWRCVPRCAGARSGCST